MFYLKWLEKTWETESYTVTHGELIEIHVKMCFLKECAFKCYISKYYKAKVIYHIVQKRKLYIKSLKRRSHIFFKSKSYISNRSKTNVTYQTIKDNKLYIRMLKSKCYASKY